MKIIYMARTFIYMNRLGMNTDEIVGNVKEVNKEQYLVIELENE